MDRYAHESEEQRTGNVANVIALLVAYVANLGEGKGEGEEWIFITETQRHKVPALYTSRSEPLCLRTSVLFYCLIKCLYVMDIYFSKSAP